MKRSRDPESSEGGWASPTHAIAACWHDDTAQSFSSFGPRELAGRRRMMDPSSGE